MDNQVAYSAFVVKALDQSRRTFSGVATTPSVDRMLDTIDPLGAKFTNPLVLLHQHRSDQPIGRVTFKKPTKKGIEFDAEIPFVDEPGPFKDRCDTAWGEIAYGVVRCVSIGFRPIKYSYMDNGGIEYSEIEIYELSTVSIGALSDAVITSIKSMSGASLPREIIRSIRLADAGDRTVKLVQVRSNVGAVLLTK